MLNLINFVLFQSLWLSCIFGAANQILWPAFLLIGILLVVFLMPKIRHEKDFTFLVICLTLGFILDSLLAYWGLINYHTNYGLTQTAPLWILVLWAGFALTLNHSMTWLLKKPRLGSLFIIIGAPLSYFSADRLNAITINHLQMSLILISLLWFFVYAIILAFNSLVNPKGAYTHA
jgi:hypothetical protein